jgi:hypothetical protein
MSSLNSKRRAQKKQARRAAKIDRMTVGREGGDFQMLTTAIRRVVSSAAELDALLWVSEETERLKEMFPHVARARIVEIIGEEARRAEVGIWLDGMEDIPPALARAERPGGEQRAAFAS